MRRWRVKLEITGHYHHHPIWRPYYTEPRLFEAVLEAPHDLVAVQEAFRLWFGDLAEELARNATTPDGRRLNERYVVQWTGPCYGRERPSTIGLLGAPVNPGKNKPYYVVADNAVLTVEEAD
jgi:hypothetical protein